MNRQRTFGEWLEDELKARKWSQSAFAERIGVARSTVSSWVNDIQPPRRLALRDIADVLEVEIDEVRVRAGQPPSNPGYRLPEDRERSETETIDLNDPRTRFFASKAGELSEEDFEVVRAVIERLTRPERDGSPV